MKHTLLTTVLLLMYTAGSFAQVYHVKRVKPGTVDVHSLSEKPWQQAEKLSAFAYPWQQDAPPPTLFRALWDDEWLYLRYDVTDDSVMVLVKTNGKLETGASDRVEIFMNINDSMQPYYCLEMDANGRVLDYKAEYYRVMHYNWQWPAHGLIVKTQRTGKGYIVQAALSIATLKALGLLNNTSLHAGLFRADCTGFINGRANLHWISWIKPASAQPDFHIPSAFGQLILN